MPLKQFDWSSFNPQLDAGLTAQQIRSMRYNCTWRRGMECPNRIGSDENHNVNCEVCDGTGFLYDDDGVPEKMLVTSISLRQQYQSFGRFDAGMGMITALPGTRLSWWDKVTFNESKIRFTEAFAPPKAGLTQKLKYLIVDETAERGVLRLVSATKVKQRLGIDYSIVNGAIQWTSKPSEKFFSVMYLIRPTYILLDISHHIRQLPTGKTFGKREQTTEFPILAAGKLDFLVGRENAIPQPT